MEYNKQVAIIVFRNRIHKQGISNLYWFVILCTRLGWKLNIVYIQMRNTKETLTLLRVAETFSKIFCSFRELAFTVCLFYDRHQNPWNGIHGL